MRDPLRMQAVQPPIIPIVGELVRSCPGTISLGQGVVSYGPPPEVIRDLGSKVIARRIAQETGLPVIPATANSSGVSPACVVDAG